MLWESPVKWVDRGGSYDPLLPGALHEQEQPTPGGSRRHTFTRTSPDGTNHIGHYLSPAGGHATADDRIAWRLRIARDRAEARGPRMDPTRSHALIVANDVGSWRTGACVTTH